jgi:hypothetical protein
VPRGHQSAEKLPATKRAGLFAIKMDRMGNIIVTHTERSGDVFLQFEADKDVVYDILKKSERKDLDAGWNVEIKDIEPRASILQELWDSSANIELLASAEGGPIKKFCCRQCGECAPKELLEEGRFLDRISWLRSHYKEKHPGMWGKRLPLTMVEGGEPVLPQYRHLVGLVSEPLPKEAD